MESVPLRSNVIEDFCRRPLLTVSCLLLLLTYCGQAADSEFPTPTWKTATPESQGLDSAVLAEALDYIRARGVPAHSFLVVRNGIIVLEAYFYPYQGREVHDVASVTKSFTSAAVGIAIEKGFIKGVDEKVLSIVPLVPSGSDRRKQSLTIRHLLTMTSGFECDTEGGEKALAAMRHSKDWAAFALALPMRADPGSQFAYCSCNNHLLSSLVTAATGESLLQLAQKNLFQPIGIEDVIWPPDPNGLTHGWGDLHLHPRDMARFGLLYLHQGKWGDVQVLPETWVRESSSESVTVRPGVGYGYSWWINTARPPIFEAVVVVASESVSFLRTTWLWCSQAAAPTPIKSPHFYFVPSVPIPRFRRIRQASRGLIRRCSVLPIRFPRLAITARPSSDDGYPA